MANYTPNARPADPYWTTGRAIGIILFLFAAHSFFESIREPRRRDEFLEACKTAYQTAPESYCAFEYQRIKAGR